MRKNNLQVLAGKFYRLCCSLFSVAPSSVSPVFVKIPSSIQTTQFMQKSTFSFLPKMKVYVIQLLLIGLSFLGMLSTNKTYAQLSVANYTYATGTNGSLVLDKDANAIDMTTGTTQLYGGGVDTYTGAVTNIGFNFTFMGTTYTQFSCNPDGQVRLGSTVITGHTSSATAGVAFLVANNADGKTDATGKVHYKVQGTAPNRVLIIEWKDVWIYWSTSTTTFSTYQARIYENGTVEYVYGRMYNNNSSSQTTSIGISSAATAGATAVITTLNTTPTLSTTATSFTTTSYTASSDMTNLNSTADGSRRYFRFTPSTTAPADAITMTFSALSSTTTTVNWVDNSTNEGAFLVTRATDAGFTANVVTATVSSTTRATTGTAYSSVQSSLLPGTTYYYKVTTLSEAASSSPGLSGSQATSAPGNIVSSALGGNWSAAATWVGGVVPTATDNVTIADGATVTIDNTSARCYNLTVGQGTSGILTWVAGTVAATLNVSNDVTVAAGGTFNSGTGTGTKTLNIGGGTSTASATALTSGNVTVNGIFNMASSGTAFVGVSFFGSGNATISGTGATCAFQSIVVNKGATQTGSTLEATRVFTIPNVPTTGTRLTLTAGTFKISSATTIQPYFGSQTICASIARLWLNNAGASVTCVGTGTSATGAGSPTVTGTLKIDAGTFGYGQGNNTMTISSTTGSLEMTGGTLNMYGAISFSSSTGTSFIMSGGAINVDPQNIASLATGTSAFSIGASTTVNWSGGTITIVDPHSASGGTAFTATSGGTKSVTGGTLRLGDGTSTTTGGTLANTSGFGVISGMPIYNLEVDNRTDAFTSRMARITGQTTVSNSINVKSNGYLFLASGTTTATTIFTGSTLTVNGTLAGTEPAGTQSIGTFQFTGTGAQTVSGAGNFTNIGVLAMSNTGSGVTLSQTNQWNTIRVNFFQGNITNSNKITLGLGGTSTTTVQYGQTGGTVNAGSFDAAPTYNSGTGSYTVLYSQETPARTMGYEIPTSRAVTAMTVNNTNGVVASGGNFSVGTLTLTAGNLTTSSSNVLTITGTTTGSISGGSSTSYINGPLVRTLPASLVSGSTYVWPVGKTAYNPFELVNPVTTAGGTVTVQSEVFDGATGGSAGSLIGAIQTATNLRYWSGSITSGAANFTSSAIRLNDTRGTADAIAGSATVAGAYDLAGGVATTTTATSILTGTPNPTTLAGYYVMANKAAATLANLAITPTGNQCTNVARTVTVDVTPGGASITGVVLAYQINGGTVNNVTMTNSTGNGGLATDTWTGTIPTVTPANGTVTWTVTATDANSLTKSATGTSYQDEPLTAVTVNATASSSTVCAGSAVTLNGTTSQSGINATIGTGTTTSSAAGISFFPGSWGGAKTQYVILASELTAAGLTAGSLNSLTFEATSSGQAYQGFAVQLGHTTQTAMTTTFITSGLTQVYKGTGTDDAFTPAVGFNTLSFGTGAGSSSSFTWDGTSNIVVSICWSRVPAASTSTSSTLRVYAPGYTCTAYDQSDLLTPADECSKTVADGTGSSRPIFTFGKAPLTYSAYSWSDGSTVIGTTASLVVNPSTTTSYTLTVTETGTGCTKSSSAVTVNTTALPASPSGSTGSTQCGTGIPTCFVVGGTDGAYRWYTVPTGGTAIAGEVNSTLTTTSISTTTTFYVSIWDGTCESLRTSVVATVNAPDVVTAVVDNNNPCRNAPIQLTANQTGSTQAYTYTWTASPESGSGLSGSSIGSPISVTPTTAGTYVYTVNAVDGACSTSSTVTVTVKELPTIATTTATPSVVCAGGTSNLAATSTGIAAGNATIGTGTSANTTSSYPAAFGTYWGNVHAQYLISASELTAAGLVAGNLTSITFDVTALGSPVACTGYTVKMGNTATAAISSTPIATTATVYGPQTFTPVVGANTITFSTPFAWDGTSNVVIDICFNNGVTGSTNSTSRLSTTSFVSSGYYGTDGVVSGGVCANTLTSGTASSRPNMIIAGQKVSDISGSLSWSWEPGSLTGNTVSVNPLATTSYTVTATNSTTGCSNTASVEVTANPIPAAPTTTPSEQCGAGVPTASVTSISGDPSPTFKWYSAASGGTLLQNSASTTYTSVVSATTSLYVSEVSSAGCESERTEVVITVYEPDAITAAASVTNVCLNGTTDLSMSYTPLINNYSDVTMTASPETGSGITGTVTLTPNASGTDPYTVTPTAVGSYTYTITAYDPGTLCTTVSTIVVTVNANPVVSSVSASPTTVCAGDPVTLTATSIGVAAGTATVGTGATTTSATGISPFSQGYETAHTQYLITAADLTAAGLTAGNLTAISFNATTGVSTLPFTGYTVKVGATTATALTGLLAPTFTTVYGPAAYPAVSTTGTKTITFSTPYNWDGTSNLLVDICFATDPTGTGGTLYTSSSAVAGTVKSYTAVYGYYNDNTNICGTTGTNSTSSTTLPDFTFSGQIATNIASTLTWEWNTSPATTAVGSAAVVTVNPTETTAYTATVTNAANCSVTSSPVTVTVNPLPTAPSASGSTQCGPGIPTASVTTGGANGTFLWYSAPTGGTLLQTGGSTYTSSISSTTTFYVAESNGTCTSTRTAVTAEVTTPPTIDVSGSTSSAICLNGTVTLAATSTANYVYTWTASPSSGSGIATTLTGSGTGTSSDVVTPTVAGTYTYTVSGTGDGCSNLASFSVTVNPNPTITSAAGSPSTVCVGGSTALVATSIPSAAGTATVGAGATTTSTYNAPFYSAWSNKHMQIMITASELTASGLVAGNITSLGFPTTSGSTSLVGFTVKLAHTTASDMSAFVTTGLTQVYTNASQPQVANTNNIITLSTPFAWDGTSNLVVDICFGNSATTATLSSTSPADVTSYVSVIKTHTSSATAAATACSNNTTSLVTYSTRPKILVGGQIGNDITGTLNWVWNPGSLAGAVQSITPGTTTSYTVTATNPVTGCSTTSSPVLITVTPVTATVTSSAGAALCIGGSSTLTAVPVGQGPFTYSWSDGSTVVGTDVTLSVTPTVTTTYTVTVNDLCGASTTASQTVTVNPLPTASISEVGPITICQPATQTLTAVTNAATPLYQWRNASGNISGANAATYEISTVGSGTYSLVVTESATGCASVASTGVSVTLNAKPSAVVVTPASPSICAGSSVSLVATGGTVSASNTGFIGTGTSTVGTTSYPNPLSAYYGGAKHQILFTVADLTALGMTSGAVINTIGLSVAAVNTSGTLNDFTIRMGHTSNTALTGFVTGTTPVYNGSWTPSVTGTVNWTLSSTFTWNGTSNVIVEFVHNAGNGGNGSGTTTRYTTTTGNTVYYGYKDDVTPAGVASFDATALSLVGASSSRPNVNFGYTNAVASYTWSPATGLSVTTGATVTANPSATTTYSVSSTVSGCTSDVTNVTVTVNPVTTITSNIATASQAILQNAPGMIPLSITATGTGTVTYQWFSNTVNSTTGGTAIGGETNSSFTPGNAALGTTYYYCVASSDCGTATSSVSSVQVVDMNVWKAGNSTTNWSTASNWLLNTVPGSTDDARIPSGNTPYPVLSSSTAVNNLDLGGTLSIGANNTLTVNGAVTGTGTISSTGTSSLVTSATTTVQFTSGANTLKNLTVNGGTLTLGNALNITAGASTNSFGTVTVAEGAVLATAGNLTLKSGPLGTARVAQGSASGSYITGEVTVERYIPQINKRAWRLLSVPTKGSQTVKQAWQENQAAGANGVPGYGTILTGNMNGGNAAAVAAGFDFWNSGGSTQSYNSATQAWKNITSTNVNPIETTRGYFVYIRGDRSIAPASTTVSSSTTLRTRGTLYQGDLDGGAISVGAGKFEPIGNTYASAIDWTLLPKTGGISQTFYLWDPKAGGSSSAGAYQTFSFVTGYVPLLPGSYSLINPTTTIESGMAFMVTASGSAGTIGLSEASKVAGTGANVFRPADVTAIQRFKTDLYSVNGTSSSLVDGTVVVFDNAYSNDVDGYDAVKFANPGENLGMLRSNTKLVIEARQPVTQRDTIFFDMWNINAANYRLEFNTANLNVAGLTAVLKDSYLQTTTPLDLTGATVSHSFSTDANAASKANNRFMIVFTQASSGPLPVSFVSVSANQAGAAVKVDWTVAGENAIHHYEVERSADGRNFTTAGNVTASGSNISRNISYNWLDATPLSGANFYRIKSVGANGEIKYTNIVKVVLGGSVKPAFTISPNPVEGSIANVQFKNQPKGRYSLNLVTSDGRIIFTSVVNHAGGSSTQILNLPTMIARGAYQLEIIGPDKNHEVQTLFINTTK